MSTASPYTYLVTPGEGTHTQISGADGRADFYTAEIISSREYSAYGAELPGYSYTTSGEYRYQFQNQEVDEELWGGAVSYKYRIEDPRLGRFFSVDPLAPKYPHNSPYAFSENRVIDGVELEGLEFTKYLQRENLNARLKVLKAEPYRIKQISGTCAMAAACYLWILYDPTSFEAALWELYEKGETTVNGWEIDPQDHLEEVQVNDNPNVYRGNGKAYQADWLILSSMQDENNDFIDFDGIDKDPNGQGMDMDELASIMNKLGVFAGVAKLDLSGMSNCDKLAFISEKLRYGEVILSINASLIQEGNDGPHAVTIIRDTFYSWTDDDGVEQVRFRVQSWGSDDYEVVGSIEEVGKQINNRLVHVITK